MHLAYGTAGESGHRRPIPRQHQMFARVHRDLCEHDLVGSNMYNTWRRRGLSTSKDKSYSHLKIIKLLLRSLSYTARHLYHSQRVQPKDYPDLHKGSCKKMPNFLASVLFTDEASFSREG
ncbi:hypothetical protein TNIN_428021 [Trichonephila inaurata madagascariensis]|uniref:Uncharacterized protein n=1 Tax=Trichonephila inaurata madagascariensis TaxID=2747483 RepID=A0A8X7BSK3_9ARAC|nr:hypothetical protein TNIN_428021 [Trichonephila inaurata madagascariensis]